MNFTFRPIQNYPAPLLEYWQRSTSRFRAYYEDTLKLLTAELSHLGVTHCVIQLALSESEIRLDGLPRALARPVHPGIVLSFSCKHGDLSYPCDTYENWQDNLRAVALTLMYQRTMDRYGVTRRGEQYRGWLGLPPPSRSFTSKAEAARFLAGDDELLVGHLLTSRTTLLETYRRLSKIHHPDFGGSSSYMAKINQAKALLESESV